MGSTYYHCIEACMFSKMSRGFSEEKASKDGFSPKKKNPFRCSDLIFLFLCCICGSGFRNPRTSSCKTHAALPALFQGCLENLSKNSCWLENLRLKNGNHLYHDSGTLQFCTTININFEDNPKLRQEHLNWEKWTLNLFSFFSKSVVIEAVGSFLLYI